MFSEYQTVKTVLWNLLLRFSYLVCLSDSVTAEPSCLFANYTKPLMFFFFLICKTNQKYKMHHFLCIRGFSSWKGESVQNNRCKQKYRCHLLMGVSELVQGNSFRWLSVITHCEPFIGIYLEFLVWMKMYSLRDVFLWLPLQDHWPWMIKRLHDFKFSPRAPSCIFPITDLKMSQDWDKMKGMEIFIFLFNQKFSLKWQQRLYKDKAKVYIRIIIHYLFWTAWWWVVVHTISPLHVEPCKTWQSYMTSNNITGP